MRFLVYSTRLTPVIIVLKRLTLIIPVLLAACSQNDAATDSATTPAPAVSEVKRELSWDGYGPVVFGMTVEEAEKAVGEARLTPQDPLDAGCDYIQFASLPGVRFMVEADTLTRGDAAPEVLNTLNIAVGESLESVTDAHPRATVMPHKYDPAGYYVLFMATNRDRAIVMEVQDDMVSKIRAGLEPAVEYVESCL